MKNQKKVKQMKLFASMICGIAIFATLSVNAGEKTVTITGKPKCSDALISVTAKSKNTGFQAKSNPIFNGYKTAFLMKFKVSEIPKNAKIIKAEVYFYVWDPQENTNRHGQIFELLTPWSEMVACWNTPDSGRKWKGGDEGFSLGEDTKAAPAGDVIVGFQETDKVENPPIEYACNVTAAVQGWVNGGTNNGLVLLSMKDRKIDEGYAGRFQIYSSERKTFKPKLVITYVTE